MKQSLHRTIFCMLLSVLGMVSSAWAEDVTYSFRIEPENFTTKSYADNNKEHKSTAVCTTDDTKTMDVTWKSNQVYQNSSVMQWQKSTGYIYNITDLGTIVSVAVKSIAGDFTTYYGTAANPTSGTTVGGGFFTVSVGSATGKTQYVEVVFKVGSGDSPVARTLSSIDINTDAAQKEFYTCDEFTHDGVIVTANFAEADVKSSVVSANFSAPDMTTPGTKTVTVSYTENGVTKTATYDIEVKTIANTAETAYTVEDAIALVDAGKGLKQGVYVKGIVSEIVTPFDVKFGDLSFNISADGETSSPQFQFYRNFKGADNEKWASEEETPQLGSEVVGYGLLAKYKDTYEYASGNYVVSMKGPNKKAATITATYLESLMATATDEYDVTYNGDAELTIASSNEDVATATIVDGHVVITAKYKGVTTITISAASTDTYLAASLHYTLTVNDDSVLDATWVAEDKGYNNGQTIFNSSVNDAITLVFSQKEEKGTKPAYYTDGKGVRLYNGCNMQVKAAEGYVITGLTLYTSNSTDFAAQQGTLKIGNPTTWTGSESAVDIYYTESKGHVRISKIVIDYKVGDETAVTQLTVPVATDGAIYNLAGQRVSKAQKGLFIVNGKKVMVK